MNKTISRSNLTSYEQERNKRDLLQKRASVKTLCPYDSIYRKYQSIKNDTVNNGLKYTSRTKNSTSIINNVIDAQQFDKKQSLNQHDSKIMTLRSKKILQDQEEESKIYSMIQVTDQKIQSLQTQYSMKKAKILDHYKRLSSDLLRKYGCSAEQTNLTKIDTEIQLIDLMIKKFSEKDKELEQIWVQKQLTEKKYCDLIIQLQSKNRQLVERNQQLLNQNQDMQQKLYCFQNQYHQIQTFQLLRAKESESNKKISQLKNLLENHRCNQARETLENQISILESTRQKQQKLILQLNQEVSKHKLEKQKLHIQIQDLKNLLYELEVKNRNLEESATNLKRQIQNIRQITGQPNLNVSLEMSLEKMDGYKTQRKQKLGDFLDKQIKKLQQDLLKRGVPLEILNQRSDKQN